MCAAQIFLSLVIFLLSVVSLPEATLLRENSPSISQQLMAASS